MGYNVAYAVSAAMTANRIRASTDSRTGEPVLPVGAVLRDMAGRCADEERSQHQVAAARPVCRLQHHVLLALEGRHVELLDDVERAVPDFLGRVEILRRPDIRQLRDRIAKKSVAARVISSQTSLLVLESDADYATYGTEELSRAALETQCSVVRPATTTCPMRNCPLQ